MFDKIKELMQLKAKMEEIKKQLDGETVEASSGDGLVYVKMTGSQRIAEIKLSSCSPDKAPAIEKALKETINRAIELSMQLAAKKMGDATGFKLPSP